MQLRNNLKSKQNSSEFGFGLWWLPHLNIAHDSFPFVLKSSLYSVAQVLEKGPGEGSRHLEGLIFWEKSRVGEGTRL